jgi:sarcosine oxidase
MPLYEVIVVGLGAVGSAATWHLARLGTKVLGIDRYKPPHEFGSSTGETRLTRAAVGEGVEYSPLALRPAIPTGPWAAHHQDRRLPLYESPWCALCDR